MGSFTDAASGNAQNVTQQNQFANSLNGTLTATASLAPYGSTSLIPLQAHFATGVTGDQAFLNASVVGDTGPRLTLGVRQSDGYGQILQNSSAGVLQAKWYAQSGPAWKTDQAVTVNGAAQLDGTVTIPGLTVTSSATFSGTFTCSGTVNAQATGLANTGVINTATSGASLALSDDTTNLLLLANAPSSAARNLSGSSIDAAGGTHLGWTALTNGNLKIASSLKLLRGGSVSRISTASAALPFASCTPSCYGTATVSHGLGTTPDGATSQCGDGGSGSTNTFLQGFDQLGSSTAVLWCSEGSGQTFYVRLVCFKL